MVVSCVGHAMAGGSHKMKGEVRDDDFFHVAGDSKAKKSNHLDHILRCVIKLYYSTNIFFIVFPISPFYGNHKKFKKKSSIL